MVSSLNKPKELKALIKAQLREQLSAKGTLHELTPKEVKEQLTLHSRKYGKCGSKGNRTNRTNRTHNLNSIGGIYV